MGSGKLKFQVFKGAGGGGMPDTPGILGGKLSE